MKVSITKERDWRIPEQKIVKVFLNAHQQIKCFRFFIEKYMILNLAGQLRNITVASLRHHAVNIIGGLDVVAILDVVAFDWIRRLRRGHARDDGQGHQRNRSEYRSASFMTKRKRICLPAILLTSLPFFQVTTRSIASPKISGQSGRAKPSMGLPSAF